MTIKQLKTEIPLHYEILTELCFENGVIRRCISGNRDDLNDQSVYLVYDKYRPVGIILQTDSQFFSYKGIAPFAIFIKPEYRNKGLGRRMISYYSKKSKDEVIVAVGNTQEGKGFYKKLEAEQPFSKPLKVKWPFWKNLLGL